MRKFWKLILLDQLSTGKVFKDEVPWNIDCAFVTLDVLNVLTLVNCEHPANIKPVLVSAELVTIPETVVTGHPERRSNIFVQSGALHAETLATLAI